MVSRDRGQARAGPGRDAPEQGRGDTRRFDVGNRHFPLAMDGEDLLVPDDTAMEQLLSRLGVAWKRRAAIFAPLGGKSWEHGRSALDGHSHVHPHYHHD
jgi:Urease accessory protein UreE